MKKFSFLIPVLALSFLLVSCNNYGEKATKEHIETYYKDGITKEEAQKTADLMYSLDVNNAKTKKSFQLTKENGTVHFRMVVDESRINQANDLNFLAISNMVSESVFAGVPVDMDLTDNKFKTIRSLPFKKVTDEDFKK